MIFDIEKVPFSRFGSYFAISKKEGLCYLRDLHGGDEAISDVFILTVKKDGVAVDFNIICNEYKLIFKVNEKEYVKFVFGENNIVNIMTVGVSLNFKFIKSRYDSFFKTKDNVFHYDFYTKEIKMEFTVIDGNIHIDTNWKIVGNDKIEFTMLPYTYLVIEEFKTIKNERKYADFDFYELKVKKEFEEFYKLITSNESDLDNLAAYIMWSCVVHEEGLINNNAMYMSKNCMNNIWSWDNMFNAMALSYNFPELAYNQLKIFIDYQDKSGCYPDFVNDKYVSYNCVKPPINCWAFSIMRKNNSFFDDKNVLKFVYESLKKQLFFWVNHRTYDEYCAPLYFHGNDSGWDNSSVFHEGMPVESPDLLALLVREFDLLAGISCKLGLTIERELYKNKADYYFNLLMNEFYKDEKFVGRNYNTKNYISNTNSLILRLPIIIGYRMKKKVLDKIVEDLEKNFEVDYGLITESKDSRSYKKNGYWLGSIWGAPTFMIYLALKENGYLDFSERIKDKFKKLVAIGGMSENFDGFTGEGYSDPAFTWTSSIYFLITNEKEVILNYR